MILIMTSLGQIWRRQLIVFPSILMSNKLVTPLSYPFSVVGPTGGGKSHVKTLLFNPPKLQITPLAESPHPLCSIFIISQAMLTLEWHKMK